MAGDEEVEAVARAMFVPPISEDRLNDVRAGIAALDRVRSRQRGTEPDTAKVHVEATRSALGQVDSLIGAIYDPNDVGAYGAGWRGALDELRKQLRLRWGALAGFSVDAGKPKEER